MLHSQDQDRRRRKGAVSDAFADIGKLGRKKLLEKILGGVSSSESSSCDGEEMSEKQKHRHKAAKAKRREAAKAKLEKDSQLKDKLAEKRLAAKRKDEAKARDA